LLGSIFVVTLILIFQHNSLEASGSYIPLLIALSLLATVHAIPWIETHFHQRHRITLGEDYMATRGYYPAASYQAAVDSDSVHSSEGSLGNSPRVWSPPPLAFEHMYLNGHSQRTGIPGSPDNSDSLDLETGLHEQAQVEVGPREPFF
jgi:hypothetical protein